MQNLEKTRLQVIHTIKTWPTGSGNLGNTTQAVLANWEQTRTNTIVENTHLFNVHQQVHYRAQLTRYQIRVNWNDKLHNVQPPMHGHPIMMWQSTNNTWVCA
jgi:hypothetical protein